ncbi:MAG: hypothetical protein ChlgKO_07350 [Chlamydiales bacterium]
MQINYFIHSCENIIKLNLNVLGDFEVQKKMWFSSEQQKWTFSDAVEHFLENCLDLFDTREYIQLKDEKACLTLMKLYSNTRRYYGNINSLKATNSERELFSNSDWIEIKNLAIQTKIELTKLLTRLKNER